MLVKRSSYYVVKLIKKVARKKMELEASSSMDDQICKLCNINQRRYVCPKCSVGYCSLECYKSTTHLECSEMFYKHCVEEELQMQQCNPELRQKTLDMLQRIYNDDAEDDILHDILQSEETDEFDYEADLDSDDENLPSLEKRLQNINLDDANELWSALTVTERQEFEALIHSGEASNLLPPWNPWWTYFSKKKLVEELDNTEEHQMYINNCPTILDTPMLASLSKVSPFIRFSIINTVYAYSYTVLHFNGEHHSTPLDAIYVFLRICDTMRNNRVYKDSLSAVENVLLEITNCDALSGDQETIIGAKEAGDAILNGPEEENKTFYMLAALSDLHQSMLKAKKELLLQKTKPNNDFKSKFQSNIDLGSTEISKKNLTLLSKKIEFYIAWLKSQSQIYDITEGEKM